MRPAGPSHTARIAGTEHEAVARAHHQQHRAGEQRDGRSVGRVAAVGSQMFHRIHLYGQCNQRNHADEQRRHRGERRAVRNDADVNHWRDAETDHLRRQKRRQGPERQRREHQAERTGDAAQREQHAEHPRAAEPLGADRGRHEHRQQRERREDERGARGRHEAQAVVEQHDEHAELRDAEGVPDVIFHRARKVEKITLRRADPVKWLLAGRQNASHGDNILLLGYSVKKFHCERRTKAVGCTGMVGHRKRRFPRKPCCPAGALPWGWPVTLGAVVCLGVGMVLIGRAGRQFERNSVGLR